MLENQAYHWVRPQMRPGDVIAFGGNSLFSRWTKFTTRSVVTHVAIVMHTNVLDDRTGRHINQVMEATSFNGKRGVMINRLSERLNDYNGDMWWLPLGSTTRTLFEQNKTAFFNFMFAQQGLRYDILQLFGSVVDTFDNHPLFSCISYNTEDFSSWFCSELIAEGLETAGVVNGVNASEVTPIDICRFAIFDNRYVQLKGNNRIITGFNSMSADNWGQIA